jgi:hypothetical protein
MMTCLVFTIMTQSLAVKKINSNNNNNQHQDTKKTRANFSLIFTFFLHSFFPQIVPRHLAHVLAATLSFSDSTSKRPTARRSFSHRTCRSRTLHTARAAPSRVLRVDRRVASPWQVHHKRTPASTASANTRAHPSRASSAASKSRRSPTPAANRTKSARPREAARTGQNPIRVYTSGLSIPLLPFWHNP